MNDIFQFHKLFKAAYPSLNASVTITLTEDGHKVSVANYKVRLTGTTLHNGEVEVQADSPTAALTASKKPVAQSRRRKAALGVLSECNRLSGFHLDEGQQEALLAELLNCHYANYEDIAASCRKRAQAIGQANLEAQNQELAHS